MNGVWATLIGCGLVALVLALVWLLVWLFDDPDSRGGLP